MAGNRQVFEQAMRQGTNFAWDRQWNKAITEYQRARAEFPEEPAVYAALGQALVYANRVLEALEIYQKGARLAPNDPMALARVAELQEQSGDIAGAVRTWLHTADVQLRNRAVDAAVQVWQHLIEIAPDTAAAHERLAKAYAGMEHSRKAIQHYLSLAAIYQQSGQTAQANAACQKALELDPRNPEVLTAMEALKQGRSIAELIVDRRVGKSVAVFEVAAEAEERTGSLVDMFRQQALTELADSLLEDSGTGDLTLATALAQGIDFQTRGNIDAAIVSFEKAVGGGIQSAAARFNLGLLYQETLRFEDAVAQFEDVVDDPQYFLGARFALGECLRALGQRDEAVAYFIQVLNEIDLASVGPESAPLLQESYDALARRYAAGDRREAVADFVNALVEFLSGDHWEDRVLETRQQLNRLGGGRVISLAEILRLAHSTRILDSMVQSQQFLEQGMLRSASEECLWSIERAPEYLPLHLHLAQLFMQGNEVGKALSKYLAVADTFAARGEVDQSMGLYEQVLQMAPMNLDVRHKLIRLLGDHRRFEQALEHRLALADAYYELAQIEASREQYEEALRVASRLDNSKTWTARILHRLGDIDLQRLDWRSAIGVYGRLKRSVPEDTRARQRLVELHFNLGRHAEATKELDELLSLYRRDGELLQGLSVLDELLITRPEELELHKRAAQLSVETGNKKRAITHLDAMGELQLQLGRINEAKATIKAIVALGPENIEAYRQLLAQIS